MLVTDNVPDRYENTFEEHNLPHKPVRMFTYLVGEGNSDLGAAKWIACEFKGASVLWLVSLITHRLQDTSPM